MGIYRNVNGKSGIAAYHYDAKSISVDFKNGETHEYTVDSVGAEQLAKMKELADSGVGLHGWINKNVRYDYSRILQQ